jgi:hypothetical protein
MRATHNHKAVACVWCARHINTPCSASRLAVHRGSHTALLLAIIIVHTPYVFRASKRRCKASMNQRSHKTITKSNRRRSEIVSVQLGGAHAVKHGAQWLDRQMPHPFGKMRLWCEAMNICGDIGANKPRIAHDNGATIVNARQNAERRQTAMNKIAPTTERDAIDIDRAIRRNPKAVKLEVGSHTRAILKAEKRGLVDVVALAGNTAIGTREKAKR